MLMCKGHWFTVAPCIRDAVWATYRPGQEVDKQPSKQWHLAAVAAIGYVARREKKMLTTSEREALKSFAL